MTAALSETVSIVEEPSVDALIPVLVKLLGETRARTVAAKRFCWLYQSNPDGEAVVWTLRRQETGEVVGYTSCLPRRMWANGQMRTCWIGCDFSILPKYRTLGPAIKLRRAAREQIDRGRVDFLYAHPNDRMAVIHERAGHFQAGSMIRLAKLITSRTVLKERFRSPSLALGLSPVVDAVLKVTEPEWRIRRTLEIAHCVSAEFGPEYDALFDHVQNCYPLVGIRDARYLNWRYITNPLQTTQWLAARRGGRLVGYLIFKIDEQEGVATIDDLFPTHDPGVVAELLATLTDTARQQGLRSATMTLLETHPLIPILRRFQYRPRAERSRMFAYAPEGSDLAPLLANPSAWCMTAGDRDV